MIRILAIISLTIGFNLQLVGQDSAQCDSIKIYNGIFDNHFQQLYESIESDSVLAVRYCGSTNGCANSFGILVWKKDNKFFFKKLQSFGKRDQLSDKLKKDLQAHLISFYTSEIFNNNAKIEIDRNTWIDDGELTLVLFKTKNSCWRFNYGGVYGDEDEKVKWIKRLKSIVYK